MVSGYKIVECAVLFYLLPKTEFLYNKYYCKEDRSINCTDPDLTPKVLEVFETGETDETYSVYLITCSTIDSVIRLITLESIS